MMHKVDKRQLVLLQNDKEDLIYKNKVWDETLKSKFNKKYSTLIVINSKAILKDTKVNSTN